MEYTSAHLTAVRTARLRGERTVQFADRSVTYKSDEELRQLERDILADLGRTNRRTRQFYGVSSKGLGS